MYDRKCSVCDGEHYAKGYCQKHLRRLREGRPLEDPAPQTCSYCDRPMHAKGLCKTHYERTLTGIPLDAPVRGETVSYQAAHGRVRSVRGDAWDYPCVDCGSEAAEWSYNHQDPDAIGSRNGDFSMNPDFYEPRCKACHVRFDVDHRKCQRLTKMTHAC